MPVERRLKLRDQILNKSDGPKQFEADHKEAASKIPDKHHLLPCKIQIAMMRQKR